MYQLYIYREVHFWATKILMCPLQSTFFRGTRAHCLVHVKGNFTSLVGYMTGMLWFLCSHRADKLTNKLITMTMLYGMLRFPCADTDLSRGREGGRQTLNRLSLYCAICFDPGRLLSLNSPTYLIRNHLHVVTLRNMILNWVSTLPLYQE